MNKFKNKIIKWLGGWTYQEINFAISQAENKDNKVVLYNGSILVANNVKVEKYDFDFNWKYTQQKEQQENNMPREISEATTFTGVPGLAYTSELGTEEPKTMHFYGPYFPPNKTLYQNKKKVRSRKQSKFHSRPSRGQRNTPRRQHGSNKKA